MQFDFRGKWNCLQTCGALEDAFAARDFPRDRKVECVCAVFQKNRKQHAYVFSQSETERKHSTCWVNPLCYCLTSIHSRCNLSFLFIPRHYSIHLFFHSLWFSVLCLSTLRAEGEKTNAASRRKRTVGREAEIHFYVPVKQRQIFFGHCVFSANTVNPTLYSLLLSSFDILTRWHYFFFFASRFFLLFFCVRLSPHPIVDV